MLLDPKRFNVNFVFVQLQVCDLHASTSSSFGNWNTTSHFFQYGSKGSLLKNKNESIKVDAFKVDAIDTVAAGDTFVGYFVSALASGKNEKEAMLLASKASSITVSRKGSLVSIPTLKEIYEKYSD